MDMTLLVPVLTAALLSGCGESGGNTPPGGSSSSIMSESSSSYVSSFDSSSSSVVSASSISSASSSNNSSVDINESIYCDETNVSNLGEPLNGRGYYGDNVCFGPFKIVGKWIMAWFSNGPYVIEFRSDGTTLQYDENWSPNYELTSYYGVSEDGKTLKYVDQEPAYNGGGVDSEYNVFEYQETSQEYPNWLKTTLTQTSYFYSHAPQVYDPYWICRIIDDEISSCYIE